MISDIKVSYSERCTSFKFNCEPKYFDYLDVDVQEWDGKCHLNITCDHKDHKDHKDSDMSFFNVSIPDDHINLYSDVVVIPLKYSYLVRVYKAPIESKWEKCNEL